MRFETESVGQNRKCEYAPPPPNYRTKAALAHLRVFHTPVHAQKISDVPNFCYLTSGSTNAD